MSMTLPCCSVCDQLFHFRPGSVWCLFLIRFHFFRSTDQFSVIAAVRLNPPKVCFVETSRIAKDAGHSAEILHCFFFKDIFESIDNQHIVGCIKVAPNYH